MKLAIMFVLNCLIKYTQIHSASFYFKHIIPGNSFKSDEIHHKVYTRVVGLK